MEDRRIDLDQVRALVKIASEADITELSVESPTLKVSIKKGGPNSEVHAAPVGARATAPGRPAAVPGAAPAAPALEPALHAITAPMVGTFFRSPSPEADPFVDEGDTVEVGQTVCIIEAMKLFNEIQSDAAGVVRQLLVENGTPVEYGQPLMLIETGRG